MTFIQHLHPLGSHTSIPNQKASMSHVSRRARQWAYRWVDVESRKCGCFWLLTCRTITRPQCDSYTRNQMFETVVFVENRRNK